MICTWSTVVSRAFLFCALKKLSFLFHLDAAVFLFCSQSAEYMGKPASSNHPKGLRISVGTVKPPWLVAASHPPGVVTAGPGHLDSAPRSAMDLLPDLHQSLPCSGPLFFPLRPLFYLAPFNCNLFRAGTLCVYKGPRTMCPK